MLRIESSKWVKAEELEMTLGLDFNYFDKKGLEEIRALEPNMQAIQFVDRAWVRRDADNSYSIFKVKTKSSVKRSYATRLSSFLALVTVATSDSYGDNTSVSRIRKWLKTNRKEIYDNIPCFYKKERYGSDKSDWKIIASNKALFKREGLAVCVELPMRFDFVYGMRDCYIRAIKKAMVKNHLPLNIYVTDLEKKEVLVRWGFRVIDHHSTGYDVVDISGKELRVGNLIELLRKALNQTFYIQNKQHWRNSLLDVGKIRLEDYTPKKKVPSATKVFEHKSEVIIDGFGVKTLAYGYKPDRWYMKLEGFEIPIKYPSFKKLLGAVSLTSPKRSKGYGGQNTKVWKPTEFLGLLAEVTKMDNEKLIKLFKNLVVMKS